VNGPSADELVANSQELVANSQERGSSTCKDTRRPIALPLLVRADEVIECAPYTKRRRLLSSITRAPCRKVMASVGKRRGALSAGLGQ